MPQRRNEIETETLTSRGKVYEEDVEQKTITRQRGSWKEETDITRHGSSERFKEDERDKIRKKEGN
jgi:hypothetical protein